MSQRDKKQLLRESKNATRDFRRQVFVGLGDGSFQEALDNAWHVARSEKVPEGTEFRVLEHTGRGENPFTDHRVVLVIGG